MRASVVIPWHRNLDDLTAAIESVLAQDEQSLEVIVVANGVIDSLFWSAVALSPDPRVKVLRLKAPDASAARNFGMQAATGDLVFFLDADDTFLPGKVSTVLRAFSAQPLDVVFSRGERLRGEGTSWAIPQEAWQPTTPLGEFFFCGGNNISTSALVVSAAAKERLAFRSAATPYEDPDLLFQAEAQGMTIRMLPEVLYRWSDHRSEGRLSRTLNAEQRLAWAASLPATVSRRARAAFGARCVAQHLFPRRPGLCLRLFGSALRYRAMPVHEVALFAVRGLLPRGLRRRLLNVYLSRRAVTP